MVSILSINCEQSALNDNVTVGVDVAFSNMLEVRVRYDILVLQSETSKIFVMQPLFVVIQHRLSVRLVELLMTVWGKKMISPEALDVQSEGHGNEPDGLSIDQFPAERNRYHTRSL